MKLWAGRHECGYFLYPLYFLCKQYILVTSGQHDIVCKITCCIGPDETLPYIAHENANCCLSEKKILTINEQAISLSVVRLLMSPWMDNERETDEMNKGVTFHFVFYFFFFCNFCQINTICFFFSISILSIEHDLYFGNKKVTF